jgi:hypothetical protein
MSGTQDDKPTHLALTHSHLVMAHKHLEEARILPNLPTEIIVEIFKHVLRIPTSATRPIIYLRFASHISPQGRLGRCIVLCKAWKDIMLEAYYTENTFRCTTHIKQKRSPEFDRPDLPRIYPPPRRTRHWVRRLDITIDTTWFRYRFPNICTMCRARPTHDQFCRDGCRRGAIALVSQLKESPDWRALCDLTNTQNGFSRLVDLKIELGIDWTGCEDGEEQLYGVLRRAEVVVRASKISVVRREEFGLEDLVEFVSEEVVFVDM